MKHGGDLLSYQHLYDGELIDFSSNINPLGYPEALNTIIPQELKALTVYPDIQYRALRKAIAAYLSCQPDEVLVGNGSMEILDYLCRIHQRVIVCTPCFVEYQERAAEYHKPVVALPLDADFRVSAASLEEHVQTQDVIVLGNPNNPTGKRIERQELVEISQLAADRHAFLALDEAFFEFCPDDYDSIQLLYGQEHVCIIRAATKFFGLPGLRLGYAYAVPSIARRYHQATLPWSVNALADLAGQVIFQETEFIQTTKTYVAQQRAEMLSQLRIIAGMQVYDTDANFILIKLLDTDEDTIFEQLARRGLLIRKASSFAGLDHSYIRIAIKDHNSNQRLLHAFGEIFGSVHV